MPANTKHIVLITTKQPSSNPRLVKEAAALSIAGYHVSVVYNFWSMWADEADVVIIKKYKAVNWVKAGSHPVDSKFFYWYSRIRHKCYRKLAGLFKKSRSFQVLAAAQFSQELKQKAVKIKADFYIAHNLGALPIAAFVAKKNNVRYAFDAEDFHRSQDSVNVKETESATLIEDRFFGDAAFISTASPLIAAEYKKHYTRKNFTVINNVFSILQQPSLQIIDKVPLRLFWFSQTVGLKRGLQDVIAAINEIATFSILLTILGDVNEQVKQVLLTSFTNTGHTLIFKGPCSEDELILQASQHHIGLALEPGFSINNNIALSNKLFAYLLAGNAVIMSSTPAQHLFYSHYPQVGWLYTTGDIKKLIQTIEYAYHNIELLNHKRQAAWHLAYTTLNWENEQHKFLELVKTFV